MKQADPLAADPLAHMKARDASSSSTAGTPSCVCTVVDLGEQEPGPEGQGPLATYSSLFSEGPPLSFQGPSGNSNLWPDPRQFFSEGPIQPSRFLFKGHPASFHSRAIDPTLTPAIRPSLRSDRTAFWHLKKLAGRWPFGTWKETGDPGWAIQSPPVSSPKGHQQGPAILAWRPSSFSSDGPAAQFLFKGVPGPFQDPLL